jgi:hypothetical protein
LKRDPQQTDFQKFKVTETAPEQRGGAPFIVKENQ